MSSIRRQLLASLLAIVLVAGFISALAVYHVTRQEIGTLLDYQLRQMALALRDETVHVRGAIEVPPHGFDFAIQISAADGVRLHYSRSRVQFPRGAVPGHATVDTAEGPWRIYTLRQRGLMVQVGQPVHMRDRLAARAALRTMAPFVLLLPLLGLLVWLAVSRGLRPLRNVADEVKARGPSVLDPLPEQRAPQEIRPVITALNDLLPRLSRALEMQRAFVADAAHELRTPLTALRLQLQLAQRARDESERAAAFETLEQGLARATHLVEQLLTLAREEPGAGPHPVEDVDLGGVAEEAVIAHAPMAEAKDIDFGLARRDSALVMRGDRAALLTLVSNLVDNALRYTPAGGRVDVSATRTSEGLVVEVIDSGLGIPPAERERVFDRFYRAEGTDAPGSGLGLAIVRSIAERHGAQVRLEPGPEGRGLAARVLFQPERSRAESESTG